MVVIGGGGQPSLTDDGGMGAVLNRPAIVAGDNGEQINHRRVR